MGTLSERSAGLILAGTVWTMGAAALVALPLALSALPASAQETDGPRTGDNVSGQTGNYVRLELGAGRYDAEDASWLPPGFPSDPRVFFDLDVDNPAFGALAFGHSFGGNWRGEVALNMFGRSDFDGPWSFTVPASPGPHADMSGSIQSTALLANGYYDFDVGNDNVTPFVTAGLGMSRNSMGDWTRTNPEAGRPTRTFDGNDETSFAWSVGLGLSVGMAPILGKQPAKLDIAWRYFDLGSASGSATAQSGNDSEPVEPLNFEVTNQVVSIGLRIPLD